MNEIWVFRPGALGDTILALPLLERLQKKHINEKIVFWGNIDYSAIVEEFFPSVEVRSFLNRQLLPLFKCDFVKADLTVDLPAKIYVVLKKDQLLKKNLNEICNNIIWCEIKEINNKWVALQMQSMVKEKFENEFSFIRKASTNTKLLIHMGTGSPAKLVSDELWKNLINQLKTQFSITLLYGPADKKIENLNYVGVESIRDVSLKDLIAEMKEFQFYLGLDSGVSHLAGVMGLKGLALFHHTNPQYWQPMGNIQPLIVDKNNKNSWQKIARDFVSQIREK